MGTTAGGEDGVGGGEEAWGRRIRRRQWEWAVDPASGAGDDDGGGGSGLPASGLGRFSRAGASPARKNRDFRRHFVPEGRNNHTQKPIRPHGKIAIVLVILWQIHNLLKPNIP
uniref:Uncharacterized protein n=1 Tax=Oryza rufipogon TaxID=4529 RepID=A0A0E0ND54_ORYRU